MESEQAIKDRLEKLTKLYYCHLCKKEFSGTFKENKDIKCQFCQKEFFEEILKEEPHPNKFKPYVPTPQRQQRPTNPFANLFSGLLQQGGNQHIMGSVQNSDGHVIQINNFQCKINQNQHHIMVKIAQSNVSDSINQFGSIIDNITRNMGPLNANIPGGQMPGNITGILQTIITEQLGQTNQEGRSPPASLQVVNDLPKVKVTTEFKEGNKENDCSVCKDEYKLGDVLLQLSCKHLFHQPCILPWLNQHNKCPLCRNELPTDDVLYESQRKERKEQKDSHEPSQS